MAARIAPARIFRMAGWITIPQLSYTSLNGSVTSAPRSVSALPLSIPVGCSIWIRWLTANDAQSATRAQDTIAIDDVSVSFASASQNDPVIMTQPSSQTVDLGTEVPATVQFTVVATSNHGPLTYQWRKDGMAIAGANSATLTLANVQAADAGAYTVMVGNDGAALSARPPH